MHISHLSLNNFRNYGRLEIDFHRGATLLHGNNAQGKTNLLEAIYYLGTTRSPYTNQDSQLLNWDVLQHSDPIIAGRLVLTLESKHGSRQIEMRLIREQKQNGQAAFRREALVNRRKVRLMDLLGHLQVVLFIPEDVQLITGPPSQRRRYLNITLCQIDPDYCRALSQFNKVLEQRNAALKQIAEGYNSQDVLDIYTGRFLSLSSTIVRKRVAFFNEISRETQRIHYEELTGGQETLRLSYLPRLHNGGNGDDHEKLDAKASDLNEYQSDPELITKILSSGLRASLSADIARGSTNIGPHRDDWSFRVNGRDLSSYGSRGQQRTAILALKLAEINWMTSKTGETPVLLLDEVVAELDEHRRELLLRSVHQVEQSLLTATDPGMLSHEFLSQATSMTVSGGRIQLDITAEESPGKGADLPDLK